MCRDAGLDVKRVDVRADASDSSAKEAVVELGSVIEVRRAVNLFRDYEADGRRLYVREEGEDSGSRGHKRPRSPPPPPEPPEPLYRKGAGRERRHDDAREERRYDNGREEKREDRREPMQRTKRPAPSPELEERRLFAENLAPSVKWQQLKDFFKGYFETYFADVINFGDDESYGIVEFKSRQDALEACMQFNGVMLADRPVRLRQDRGEFDELRDNKRQRTENGRGSEPSRVFVGNLDFHVSWQDLKDYMKQAGYVNYCNIVKNPHTGESRGFGVCEYSTEDEAERAIRELDGASFGGRPLHVRKHQTKEERSDHRRG